MLLESKGVFLNETEIKPNKYAANVLAGVAVVIAVVCAMNELGVFDVDRTIVTVCLLVALIQFLIVRFIISKPRLIEHPASKYVIISMVLFLVLTLTVLLNIHAVLGFVIPILLATQYRSYKVSLMTLVGSCACCIIAPILSYLLNTWSLTFLTGYIESFCRVTLNVMPGNSRSAAETIGQITLYWSLPQMLTLASFGTILHSATKSGIDSVNNQMQVIDLSNDLSHQLESILTMQERMLYSMSDIIESRDIETGGHVRRTSEIVRLIMGAMREDPDSGISEQFSINVIKTAPMHDFGKIAVPDTILKKPGSLTEEEYEIV